MSGEDLYNLWVEAMDAENVGVDAWETVDEIERAAWERVAAQVRPV